MGLALRPNAQKSTFPSVNDHIKIIIIFNAYSILNFAVFAIVVKLYRERFFCSMDSRLLPEEKNIK